MAENSGVNFGRTLVQQRGTFGGSRHVFVKLQGVKNELVFPTIGGQLQNPFGGVGKIYAGDLFEVRMDDAGVNPKVYLLKTFKVKSATGTTIVIERDGFKHIPFVGDNLMVAPDEIGGEGTASKVTAVKATADAWELTMDATLGAAEGNILVEADEEGTMLVKAINAVAPCDYDCLYSPAVAGDKSDFDNARYFIAPALGGLMYTKMMSPMPACVLKLNKCNINGWFKVAL